MITGLKTTYMKLGGKSPIMHARQLLKENNYLDLIDQRILDTHNVHQLFWMVNVVEKCLSKDPTKRLTMDKANNQHSRKLSACLISKYLPHFSAYLIIIPQNYNPQAETLAYSLLHTVGTSTKPKILANLLTLS
ncbi:hypothetical protein LINPERPRIM_LOCUS37545 [Linum perenne]